MILCLLQFEHDEIIVTDELLASEILLLMVDENEVNIVKYEMQERVDDDEQW